MNTHGVYALLKGWGMDSNREWYYVMTIRTLGLNPDRMGTYSNSITITEGRTRYDVFLDRLEDSAKQLGVPLDHVMVLHWTLEPNEVPSVKTPGWKFWKK